MSRIGLIADTHDEIVSWDDTGPKVVAALGPVDLLIHCGDITSAGLLARLEEIAPVVAVRSSGDPPPDPPRLLDGPRVVEHEGVRIGVINALGESPDIGSLFGEAVGVVVHGGTHEASVVSENGVLLVNPGSPSLAERVSVAVLEVGDGEPRATIVPL
jgi:hypothetical protein